MMRIQNKNHPLENYNYKINNSDSRVPASFDEIFYEGVRSPVVLCRPFA